MIGKQASSWHRHLFQMLLGYLQYCWWKKYWLVVYPTIYAVTWISYDADVFHRISPDFGRMLSNITWLVWKFTFQKPTAGTKKNGDLVRFSLMFQQKLPPTKGKQIKPTANKPDVSIIGCIGFGNPLNLKQASGNEPAKQMSGDIPWHTLTSQENVIFEPLEAGLS